MSKTQKLKEQDEKIRTIVNNKIKPILEEYISLIDILPDNEQYSNIKKVASKSNYKELLANKAYQNSIIDRLLQTEIQLGYAKVLSKKTTTLLANLRQEIDDLKL